jgi:GTPase involved in cell partitioning and DNA repair
MRQYRTLLSEFAKYDPLLLKKPRVVVLNKIDLLDRVPSLDVQEKVFAVSALNGTGVEALAAYLKK